MEIVKIILIIITALAAALGKICPGYCVPAELCTSNGGHVLGYCVNGRVCCDGRDTINSSSCGKEAIWTGNDDDDQVKTAQFHSPDYPSHSSGSLICPFNIKLDPEAVGLELELIRFELDATILDEKIKCDSDMFFIQGFSNWMTDAKCGNLNGYSGEDPTKFLNAKWPKFLNAKRSKFLNANGSKLLPYLQVLIDINPKEQPKKITLLFLTSSKAFRWKIKIHQIPLVKLKKSELCLKTRYAKWMTHKDYPGNYTVANAAPFQGSRSDTRWKWEVDIISTSSSSAAKLAPKCPLNDNETLPLPWHRICKGTVIDDRHIVTSASCLLHQPALSSLRIATTGLCPVEPRSLRDHLYEILSVSVHFNFQPALVANDIVVMRTKRAIGFGEVVQPLRPYGDSIIAVHSPTKGGLGAVPLAEPIDKCGESLRKALGLASSSSATDLKASYKYNNVLQSISCGPMSYSPEYCEDLEALHGSPLVGLDSLNITGGAPKLVGFLTYISHEHRHLEEAYPSVASTEYYQAYFTGLDRFQHWILMAIA